MIANVREPADEFGRFLRATRKKRGLGSVVLSKAVNRSRTYIGIWERDSTVIPKRDVLLRVAEVLKLTGTERERLLMLADRRAAPNGDKQSFDVAPDPDVILLEALLDVEHNAAFPRTPMDADSAYGAAFVRAVGSALSLLSAAASLMRNRADVKASSWSALEALRSLDMLHPYTAVRWPQPFVRIGVVPKLKSPSNAIEIPHKMLEHEFFAARELKTLPSLPLHQRASRSFGMARIYRDLLFCDADRARVATSVVKRWSLQCQEDTEPRLSVVFKDTDADAVFGIHDVKWSIVWKCCERELAYLLWTSHIAEPERNASWSCDWIDSDWTALMTVVWTLTGDLPETPVQSLRDAIYPLRFKTWEHVQRAIRDKFRIPRRTEPDLEDQLVAGRLTPEVVAKLRTEPQLIASVHPDVLWLHLNNLRVIHLRQPTTLPKRFVRSGSSVSKSEGTEAAQKPRQDRSAPSTERPKPKKPGVKKTHRKAKAKKTRKRR